MLTGLSLFGGGECWRPQSVNGQDVEAVVVGVRARACGEDDPATNLCPRVSRSLHRPRKSEPSARSLALTSKRGLPVIAFDDQVDLDTVARAPVAQSDRLFQPGCLFTELSHREGLQQVAEIGQSGSTQTGAWPLTIDVTLPTTASRTATSSRSRTEPPASAANPCRTTKPGRGNCTNMMSLS